MGTTVPNDKTGEILLIDTHAHLDDPKFDEDRAELIDRAFSEAGLKSIITVGCWKAVSGFGSVMSIAESNKDIYAALGVHPHDAAETVGFTGRDPFELMREIALSNKKLVGIGETGLDYHYMHSPKNIQRELFIRHIALARELNLPLIVHSREANEETMDILEAEGVHNGVLHCFSGDMEMAKRALDLGLYISISGVVTFKKAEEMHEVVSHVPIERMLVETDSPYLAPVPKRGKRNEPSFVRYTAAMVAELKGLSEQDVARITTLNAENLFGIGPNYNGKESEKKAKIAYKIRNSLYLNITNRCSNHCTFCAKFRSYTVKGHFLRLSEEPTADELMDAIGADPASRFDEIVFCGYGEPLIRIDIVKEVGEKLKEMGCSIRIDTDGLANLYHGRNVLPELHFVDTISVSLNAPDSDAYLSIIKSPYKENAYPAILFFLREAKKHIAKVVASAVSVPGIDMEATRVVAEDELGVPFRVREYNEVG